VKCASAFSETALQKSGFAAALYTGENNGLHHEKRKDL
jgi:hypothetical protein